MVAARQPGQAGHLLLVADEAVAAARHLAVEHLIAEVARAVAVEQDAPGLDVGRVVAQRGEGDADLQRPAGRRDPRRRVPVEVGRVVLAAGVVADGVVLDAARIGEEHERGLAVVAGVEDDAAVVGVARHLVVVAEGGADALRIGVREVEGGVEEVVVVGEPGDRLHLRLDVVAGVRLVEGVHPRRAAPPRIAQPAVHLDRRGRLVMWSVSCAGAGGWARRRAGAARRTARARKGWERVMELYYDRGKGKFWGEEFLSAGPQPGHQARATWEPKSRVNPAQNQSGILEAGFSRLCF